ncbi:MAG: phosphatidate cytidylyltransferase [Campylobacterales bacterium]|nr:phosphatidate cytidylyltransferase [Campylobacterales bacterium]
MDWLGAHKERVMTGAALMAVALVVGYIDSFFLTWLLLGLIYMFAFYEAAALFGARNNALFTYAALIWIVAAFYPYGDDLFIIAGIVFASFVAYRNDHDWKDFLPFIYPTAGMLFMLSLYKEYGMIALLWLLITVAATDIGAYFVGKKFGATPFCSTSPKKTVEGVIGGVLIATLLATGAGVGIVSFGTALFISLVVAIASVFGDLFESSLKRQAGVKDSGSILPGHGGVLDRMDGYLFGSVVMVILLRGLV